MSEQDFCRVAHFVVKMREWKLSQGKAASASLNLSMQAMGNPKIFLTDSIVELTGSELLADSGLMEKLMIHQY